MKRYAVGGVIRDSSVLVERATMTGAVRYPVYSLVDLRIEQLQREINK